jgi:hypothetical protein
MRLLGYLAIALFVFGCATRAHRAPSVVGIYKLEAMNGHSIPAPHPCYEGWTVEAGRIVIDQGRLTLTNQDLDAQPSPNPRIDYEATGPITQTGDTIAAVLTEKGQPTHLDRIELRLDRGDLVTGSAFSGFLCTFTARYKRAG